VREGEGRGGDVLYIHLLLTQATNNFMDKRLSILIVGRPGSLRNGLLDLLSTISPIGQIEVVDSRGNVLHAVERLKPNVILIHAGQSEREPRLTPGELKHRLPDTRCIVIAHDVQQQASVNFAGADAVILEGTAPEDLILQIERLIR
jgi:DNA-binding NarL/FixJ family response regulator